MYAHNSKVARRTAFTLLELLVVIAIIALLAAMSMLALAGAAEQAREQRTRAIINKIDQLIREKYDGYRTRPLPIRFLPGTSQLVASQMRVLAMRDLMRMELPDRKSDVVDPPADINPVAGQTAYLPPYNPVTGLTRGPSLWESYRRAAQRNSGAAWATGGWTEVSQGAECLYLILSHMRDSGEKSIIDYFLPSEIGDLDEDGMKEILDGWGRPIEFLRWAPGYTIENDAVTLQTNTTTNAGYTHDPFDPLKRDATAFALYPLIMSSGRDKEFDIFTDNQSPTPFQRYCDPATPDNNFPKPYATFAEGFLAGAPMDRDGDGVFAFLDNITNHYQAPP
jgi:prepilin-type N-terminal cleavage/methylation domain-containing protein